MDGSMWPFAQYFQVLNEGFREERQNLVWDNRMIESRLAVAQQLTEISRIMDHMAEELYVGNTGYPYLTSCSGDFLYSIHRFSEWMQKTNNKKDRRGKDV